MSSRLILLLAVSICIPAICRNSSGQQPKIDHALILVTNSPDQESHPVRLYQLHGNFIGIYYEEGTTTPLKAIRYSSKDAGNISLPELKISKQTVIYKKGLYTFVRKTWIGPLNSHPDPVRLPPIPNPSN